MKTCRNRRIVRFTLASVENDSASDSAQIARQIYVAAHGNLAEAVATHSWNARRLLGVAQLSADFPIPCSVMPFRLWPVWRMEPELFFEPDSGTG